MRILVPVDGSEQSRHVIEYLGSIRRLRAGEEPEIELLNVQYAPTPGLIRVFGEETVRKAYEEEGMKVIESLRPAVEAAELTCSAKVVLGEMGAALNEEAERFGADLIVMASRGLNPVKGFFLGSFTNAALSHVRVPLLLIRGRTVVTTPAVRIAVALDGSEYGTAAADHILREKELFGPEATYALLHVSDSSIRVSETTPDVSDKAYAEAYAHVVKERFEAVVGPVAERFAKEGLRVESVSLNGDPAEAIVGYVREGADLLVMGSHGRGNFTAAVLGSVAMRVAAETELPMLIVRK